MGNYQQHLTVSTTAGVVLGGLAWWPCGFPASTCLVTGGLCSLGGLLPDIDSNTSRSFQDYMWMTGSIVSTLVINRLSTMDVGSEMVMFIGVSLFLIIRYCAAGIIKKFTVHRGIIHSIPAMLISGELIFLLSDDENTEQRILKAVGFSLGFLSHLILDEIYSVERLGNKVHVKKSFGTALKLFNRSRLDTTFACYIILVSLGWLAVNEPDWMNSQFYKNIDLLAEIGLKGAQKLNETTGNAQKQITDVSGIGSPKDKPGFSLNLKNLFATNETGTNGNPGNSTSQTGGLAGLTTSSVAQPPDSLSSSRPSQATLPTIDPIDDNNGGGLLAMIHRQNRERQQTPESVAANPYNPSSFPTSPSRSPQNSIPSSTPITTSPVPVMPLPQNIPMIPIAPMQY